MLADGSPEGEINSKVERGNNNTKHLISPLGVLFLGWGLLALVWQLAYLLGASGEWALQWIGIGVLILLVVWAILVVKTLHLQWGCRRHQGLIEGWVWPGAFGLGLLLVYLFFDRAHFDDGLFLPRALDLLSGPSLAVCELGKDSIPGAYREDRLLSLYWLIPAVLHSWTGIPFLSLYYGVVPGVLILLTPYAWDFCLREWFGVSELRKRIGIIIVTSILLLVWGKNAFWISHNFSPLDDGILRFQHGDAVLATTVVPVWLGLLSRFRDGTKVWTAPFLILAFAGGVGFSPIAIFLGLLILGLFGLAEICVSGWQVRSILGWLVPTIFYLGGLAAVSFLFFDWEAGALDYNHAGLFMEIWQSSNLDALRATWGVAAPGMVALGSVIYFSVMSPRASTRVYAAVILILLLIPGTSKIMYELGYDVLGWRWLWSLPIALVVAYAIGEFIGRLWVRSGWLALLSVVALSYLYIVDGRTASNAESGENHPVIRWAPIKVDGEEVLRNNFRVERKGAWILYRGDRF